MGLPSGGELENEWIETAYELQDLSEVPDLIADLLGVSGLDMVAVYLRLENLYRIRRSNEALGDATVLYEILRSLGAMSSPTKGQTISRAAEQRAGDIRDSMTGIRF